MLPDFPKVRKFAHEILVARFHKQVQETGIMQGLPKEKIHEGNRVELHRYDGTKQKVSMKSTVSEMRLERDKFEEKGLPAVLEAMDQTAADMAEKQTKDFFEQFDDICEQAGQTYDAKGQPLSFDLILDLLETIQIDFDENGQPLMPTLVSGREIQEKFDKLEMTKEQEKRFEEIIEQKRSEWHYRESDRKLVN